ncbi:28S ribosomal protein S7, mitochondrial [Orussus abietinus]|uniref:28S ribosomal protein S7, mitochondrial n=1 Tax=Orussus abietinus TaxID=222816 RepID=UPI000626A9CC|nr:28S ribosomal protein S7, mitochondrial [Orussus abietinus]
METSPNRGIVNPPLHVTNNGRNAISINKYFRLFELKMASKSLTGRLLRFGGFLPLIRPNLAQNGYVRQYSVYPTSFIKPVYKPDEQKALNESGEMQKVIFRQILPAKTDESSSEFHDELTNKLVNYIMKGGNKILARRIVEKTFESIKRIQLERYNKIANNISTENLSLEDIELDPKKILHRAVENSMPVLQLTPMKKGGSVYQVPTPILKNRSRFLAMKWLLEAGKDKDNHVRLYDKLSWELIDAAYNQGRVIKKKQDLHRQCEANRAYAHFRWM